MNVAVLYSGGTDSTAAVTLLTDRFDDIHLLTCKHSGIFHIENSATNITLLKDHFPHVSFEHHIFEMDSLFKKVAHLQYFKSIFKHGFLMLGNCGLCKLAMHVRAAMYCIDNDIKKIADGANIHMDYFPAQMTPVIDDLKAMYNSFGIEYFNPVFDMDNPPDIDWIAKLGLKELAKDVTNENEKLETAGKLLFDRKILDQENVKGTTTDRQMQARCFQLFLFNVMAKWYYLPKYGKNEYAEMTKEFYKERIGYFKDMLLEYKNNKENSVLHKLV